MNSYDFQLREIQKEDNPKVAEIIRTVMTEYDCVGEGYSIGDPEVDCMFETYSTPQSHYLVLLKNEKIVGCGGIAPLAGGDPTTCELKKMYFYSDARGAGMGTKMVAILVEKAKELGYKKCYIETVFRMERANALYKKMGFRKLEGSVGDTGHGSCDSHYIRELSH